MVMTNPPRRLRDIPRAVIFVVLVLASSIAAAPLVKPHHRGGPDAVPEGLAATDWSSIRGAYEANRHDAELAVAARSLN